MSGDFRTVSKWNVIVDINRERHVMEISRGSDRPYRCYLVKQEG